MIDAADQFKGQVQNAADQVKGATDWTQDQVQSYLDKYQISYDKNDKNLLDTVQKYRDAAVANAGYFINDKTNTIERLIGGLKTKLEKQYKLSTNDIDAFTNDIQHELKQLELSGSLTQDKVKQSLDKLQHKAIKQKYVTAAQYKEIARDLESSFVTPTWFQRVFRTGPSHTGYFTDDSFQTWISSSVTQRLQENKELTKDEINAIVNTLKKAITSTSASVQDLTKLGTTHWWKQLSHDLEKDAKLQQAKANQVVESLKDEVNAYKIFAMDYAGQAADQSQNMLAAASQYIMNTGQSIYQAIVRQSNDKEAQMERAVHSASSATDAAGQSAHDYYAAGTNAAASATDAAAASASVLRAQASQSVNDAKNSFGHFWRQKELETYKKIGYTEAHIDWIENYLSKTFHDKTNFAKESVQNAVRTIRQYLINAKVQTAAHVDSQLKSIEGLIESWRKTVVRDEL